MKKVKVSQDKRIYISEDEEDRYILAKKAKESKLYIVMNHL